MGVPRGRGGSTHGAGAGAWPAAGARAAEEGAEGRGAAIAAILRSAEPGIPSVAAAADPAGLRAAEAVRRGAAPEEAGPRSQPVTGASQVRWPESGDPPPGPEPRPPEPRLAAARTYPEPRRTEPTCRAATPELGRFRRQPDPQAELGPGDLSIPPPS